MQSYSVERCLGAAEKANASHKGVILSGSDLRRIRVQAPRNLRVGAFRKIRLWQRRTLAGSLDLQAVRNRRSLRINLHLRASFLLSG